MFQVTDLLLFSLKGQIESILGFASQEATLSLLRSPLYNRFQCSYLEIQKPFPACKVDKNRQRTEPAPWAT